MFQLSDLSVRLVCSLRGALASLHTRHMQCPACRQTAQGTNVWPILQSMASAWLLKASSTFRNMYISHFPSIQVLSHCFQVLCLQQGNCTQSCFGFWFPTVWGLTQENYICKMKTINRIDATDMCVFFFRLVLCVCATIGIIVLVWQWYCQPQATTLANNDAYLTQHKPIDRSTDMVSWPKHLKFKLGWTVFTWKTCMGSAWLQNMFMHGGVPASRHPRW